MRSLLFVCFLASACQTTPEAAPVKALPPPEKMDPKVVEGFKGQQRVPAEYEPARGVVISEELLSNFKKRQLVLDLLQSPIETLWVVVPNETVRLDSLKKAAGANFKKIKYIVADHGQQWARGWAPIGATTDEGELRFIDFHHPGSQKQSVMPAAFSAALNAKRISLPLGTDAGNFITNAQGHCMMAEVPAGNHEDIVKSLQDYAGCKKVTIFPAAPMTAGRHIDLWAKFLKDDLIVVAQLRDEVLNHYAGADLERAKAFQNYLNERQLEMESMGLTTIRIPLPNVNLGGELFPSYLSALILQDEIFVPTLGPKRNAFPSYDQEVRAVFERLGFKVHTYNFDNVSDPYAAIHCATLQVPR